MLGRSFIFPGRIDAEHLREILDMDSLATKTTIKALDEQDFAVRQHLERLWNSFELRLLDEFPFRHLHANGFCQSKIGIFVFRHARK